MSIVRNDKIYRYLKSDGTVVWFRYDIDNNGAYQFLFQTGTAAGDQTLVTGQAAFTNALNYPGATVATGNVLDGTILTSLSMPDGTAVAPGLPFTNDTDTGIYRPGANQFGITTGGVSALTLDSSGNQVLRGTLTFGSAGTAASPSLIWTGDLTTGLYSLGGGELGYSGSGVLRWKFSYGADGGGVIAQPTSGSTFGFTASGTGTIIFKPSNVLALTLASTSVQLGAVPLLCGGSVVGTGALQLLSTAGTTASGIGYGADTWTYRSSATDFAVAGTGLATIFFNRSATLGGFFNTAAGNGTGAYFNGSTFIIQTAAATALTLNSAQNALFAKLITSYNGITTAGNGVATIQGAGTVTAQVTQAAAIATYTLGAADADFIVSGNVNVTTSVTHSFTLECAYTDETNTARVVTFNVQQLGGTLITAITNVTGAGVYEGVPLHLRCKAATTITIRTNAAGTYTSVVFNAAGVITKLQ